MCEVGRASGSFPVSEKEALWGKKGPGFKQCPPMLNSWAFFTSQI